MRLSDVPRIPATAFHPPLMGGKPAVVLGNVDGWPAFRYWRPEYLKAMAGNNAVTVREAHGPPCNFYQNMAEGGKTSFREYLDWVIETASAEDIQRAAQEHTDVQAITRAICNSGFETSYYLDVKLRELSEILLGDTRVPNWYQADPVDIIFWCGIFGTSSGLHFDLKPNCNVQIAGQKKFILFPPSQARILYKIPCKTHCHFDPNVPEFDAYPMARGARGYECTLQPGESLYIPVGWFHQVTVVTSWALNVNFFWPRPFPQGLATPVLWEQLLMRCQARVHVTAERLIKRQRLQR